MAARLVSDVGLPGLDGYDLIREVRRLGQAHSRPRLLAVALTAFSRLQDGEQAMEAGFDAHVAKPLQAHQLMNVLVTGSAD